MLQRILKTERDFTLLILRVALGTVMLAHGMQKAFGLFGGYGWEGTMNYFTSVVGLPSVLGGLVILIESFGAFLLILGFAGRINAALVGIVILGALFVDHLPNGFYMNWFGNQKGEGFEFDILFLAMAFTLAVKGSGRFSIDILLAGKASLKDGKPARKTQLINATV